jgi:hypothetical protein
MTAPADIDDPNHCDNKGSQGQARINDGPAAMNLLAFAESRHVQEAFLKGERHPYSSILSAGAAAFHQINAKISQK